MKKKNKLLRKDVEFADKVHYVIINVIRLTLIIAIGGSIFADDWTVLFVSSATFILTFLPKIFEKRYKIDLPVEFEIIAVLFIYASLFLGEVHGYYTRFWWWDIILHTGSAIALGFVGFTILFVLHKGNRIKASPLIIAIFTFFFAVGIGAVWEIFEFAMDQIFLMNMQKSGLIDTMWDLIVDSVGGLIAAISGYLYLKRGEVFIFDKIMNRFKKDNPNLFS